MSYREEIEPFLEKNPYQMMNVSGANIRYVMSGESDRPLIIFLNGGMNCSEMWFKYVEKMSDEYKTLIFDYPMEITTAEETAEVIHEFFVKLGISKAFFAGASFGGMMAQIFTRKYPEMVNGLGLFSTAGLDENTIRTEKKKYRFLPILLWYMKHCNYEKLKPKVIRSCIKNYAKDETLEDRTYLQEMLEYMFKNYPKEKDIHITGMVGTVVDLKPCVKSDFDLVQDRVLLVFPENDFFSNEEQQSLKNLFPRARVEYIKNGHYGTVLEYDKYIGWMRALMQ
jgi:pimeloyl-ACP methyl ester carboxylesterase